MADIKIYGKLSNATTDQLLADALQISGAFQALTTTERNNLTSEVKKVGMLVYDSTLSKFYQLNSSNEWVEKSFEGHKYITLNSSIGTLSNAEKEIVLNDYGVKIIYNGKVYTLMLKADNIYKYMSKNDSNETFYWVNINTTSGDYTTTDDDSITTHLSNTDIHITALERTFWNNKVTASVSSASEILTISKN